MTERIALVTGASAGLGRALTRRLTADGWTVIGTARHAEPLAAVCRETGAVPVVGDVADPAHRLRLAAEIERRGGLDLLVNNAGDIGPSPLPRLAEYPLDALAALYAVNVVAPLAIVQLALGHLRSRRGIVVNVSSDAAVEAYPGWGGYGSSKAALDQLTAVFAAEEPEIAWYAFDPGDMRTATHQAAFPGEDISDRPEPQTVIPAVLRLLDTRPACGRYTVSQWQVQA